MTNPNNCSTCDHKQHPDDGHCYMFRDEPTEVCMQHTGNKQFPLSAYGLAKILLAVVQPTGPTQ